MEQIGIQAESVEELKNIYVFNIGDQNIYATVPFESFKKSIYSSTMLNMKNLPVRISATLDIDDLNEESMSILNYFSIKIVFFTFKKEKIVETATKILSFISSYDNVRFVCRCSDFEVFNNLKILCNYSPKLTVAPTLSINPSESIIWNTSCISGVFLTEKHFDSKNKVLPQFCPILKEMNRRVVPTFIKTNIKNFDDVFANLTALLQSVETQPYLYELRFPIQPLATQLQSITYETFEKDSRKYELYEEAIRKALEVKGKDAIVSICGAGRGPIVDRAIKAGAKNIIVVEKNHAASVFLRQRLEKDWPPTVSFFEGDMRSIKLSKKIDILVTELLGSFGDNELSPECIYGAEDLLAKDAISIPSQYCSKLRPVTSQYLWDQAFNKGRIDALFVVPLITAQFIGNAKDVFEFKHPGANELYPEKVIEFVCDKENTILHGFGGWFDCKLFGDVNMSYEPRNDVEKYQSWFPAFLPLRNPISVKRGQKIKLWIARKTDKRKVWYEWALIEPVISPIQNSYGNNYSIGLLSN